MRRYNMLLQGGPTEHMRSQNVNKPMRTIRSEAYKSYFTDAPISLIIVSTDGPSATPLTQPVGQVMKISLLVHNFSYSKPRNFK